MGAGVALSPHRARPDAAAAAAGSARRHAANDPDAHRIALHAGAISPAAARRRNGPRAGHAASAAAAMARADLADSIELAGGGAAAGAFVAIAGRPAVAPAAAW